MRKLIALAASAACLVVPGSASLAATVQLEDVSSAGSNFTFTYGGMLAPTEGVKSGSKLVILDFAGYVEGSIFSPYSYITGLVELTTPSILIDPSITDDPTIPNLVFTYTGPDFQIDPAPEGSPYAPISFTGLTAGSIYGGSAIDGFATLTVKNDGTAVGSTVFTAGLVAVPSVVPEPGTWGLMIIGLGAVGMAARRSKRARISYS